MTNGLTKIAPRTAWALMAGVMVVVAGLFWIAGQPSAHAQSSADPSDATLSALSLTGINSPHNTPIDIGTFDPDTTSYTGSVPYSVRQLIGSATLSNPAASFEARINGALPVGEDDGILLVGSNVITLEVTSEDGSATKTYTVTVSRAAKSTDATLKRLEFVNVDFGTFEPDTTSYSASVAHTMSEVTVWAVVNHAAASYVIKLGGMSVVDATFALEVGSNVITVGVTAEDESSTEIYTVTVTRAPVAAPTGLVAYAGWTPISDPSGGEDAIHLTWRAPPGTIPGYQILRQRSDCGDAPVVHVEDTASPTPAYTDLDVDYNVSYTYWVSAVTSDGVGPQSAPVTHYYYFPALLREHPSRVPIPVSVSGHNVPNKGIQLKWYGTAQDPTVTGHRVERREPCGTFEAVVENTESTSEHWLDANTEVGTLYEYRVSAIRLTADGNVHHSGRSNIVQIRRSNAPEWGTFYNIPYDTWPMWRGHTDDSAMDLGRVAYDDDPETVDYTWRGEVTRDSDGSDADECEGEGLGVVQELTVVNHGGEWDGYYWRSNGRVYFRFGGYGCDIGHYTINYVLREGDGTVYRAATMSVEVRGFAIDGRAQVGETLSIDTSTFTIPPLSYIILRYVWKISSDGGPYETIPGATGSAYTVASGDLGKKIKAEVWYNPDNGIIETYKSTAATAPVVPPNSAPTGAPTISGTAEVGETLTASTATIADEDGLTEVFYFYQWISNDGVTDTEITDATDATYRPTIADAGKTIKVRVSFTDDNGNEESATSTATAAIVATNSPARGAPTIVGRAEVGTTLQADTSDISDDDGMTGMSYQYQWMRNDGVSDSHIRTATNGSYTLVEEDEGKTVKVMVSFTDDAGTQETLTSAATAAVAQAGPRAFWTATLTVGEADGSGKLGYTVFGGIPGGTISSRSFELDGDANWVSLVIYDSDGLYLGVFDEIERGFELQAGDLQVKSRDASGRDGDNAYVYHWGEPSLNWTKGDSVTLSLLQAEEPEAPADPINTPATGAPSIIGTARVGDTLTVSTATIEDPDGLDNVSFSYQWIGNDGIDDADIDGVTDSSYTLTVAEVGKTIKVQVSFTDDAGSEETLASVPTTAVLKRTDRPHGLTATANEDSITLTWQEPDNYAGPDYHILRHQPEDGEPEPLVYVDFTDTGDTNFSDTDVSPGTLYVYQVRAPITIFGDLGEPSLPVRIRMPGATADRNTLPVGLPTISGTAQVGETLTAGTSGITDEDGLEDVTFSYQWLADDAEIAGATDSSYTLGDADEGKAVKVVVSFTDDDGNEETLASAATASVAPPNTAPDVPLHLNVWRHGSGALDVYWEAPESDGGSPVTEYKVQWKEAADSWDTLADVSEARETGTVYTITGLTDGVEYTVRVVAINGVGQSDPSDEAAGTPAETTPPELSSASLNGTTLTLTYSEPLDGDSTPDADAYSVTVNGDARPLDSVDILGSTVALTLASAATAADTVVLSYTKPTDDSASAVRDLAGNTAESFSEEPVANHTPAPEPAEPPAAPQNLTAEVNEDGSVTLNWDAPDDDSITGYQVLRRRPAEGENTLLVYVEDTGTTAASFTDTDVTSGTRHVYRVKAINAAGLSAWSNYVRVEPE